MSSTTSVPARRRPHPRRLLALHEAGHACWNILIDRPVAFVAILPASSVPAGLLGIVVGPPGRVPADKAIDLHVSGHVAEIIAIDDDPAAFFGDLFFGELTAGDDLQKAVSTASQFHAESGDAYEYVRSRADFVVTPILRDIWPAVEAVADKLLRKHHLSGDEVVAIYQRATATAVA